jgi:hypothetical protein
MRTNCIGQTIARLGEKRQIGGLRAEARVPLLNLRYGLKRLRKKQKQYLERKTFRRG